MTGCSGNLPDCVCCKGKHLPVWRYNPLDSYGIMTVESRRGVRHLEKASVKVMARNREAYHEYFVEEEIEAGIELVGTEVKSIRAGTLNLKDAWCGIKDGDMLLNQMHISPYDHGNRFNVDPRRPRRLLLHKREIMRLYGKVKQDGYALIPLSVYFKGSRVKVKVGLCKGKKLYDKRQAAAEKDARRQIDRAMKERNQ